MAVVHRLAAGWLVDHLAFINQCGYEIWDASLVSWLQKRKRQQELNQGELEALHYHCKVRKLIWEGSLALVQEGLRSGFLQPSAAALGPKRRAVPGHGGCGLAELCDMGKQLPAGGGCLQPAVQLLGEESSLPEQALLSCLTENSSSSARILVLMGQKYLVPPRSSFLLSDVSCLQPLLSCEYLQLPGLSSGLPAAWAGAQLLQAAKVLLRQRRFEVIVLDPPWENKSLKRSKSYSPLAPWQIKQLPVPALAAPSCLVLTWVTNRQRHLRFVREQLYPHWALQPLAEWYWVKITRAGEFVLPLDSLHKKPYEVLVLGRAGAAPQEASREAEAVPEIPAQKLIVSVPCSLHSHKPPWLVGVLAEFVKPDVQCLELFARSLQPGWTSWGNEVLKFQHMDYFTPLGDES
ncbi:N(6)-adenine-specific methyltransferase METTL4 [Dryobates pubescens]|uniref:N(6)-adenine-specific methyltransferase METTL4 n=1 Tax=Dryobates pubescens TaxID=118200 RepID=UPI0023B9D95E|nr:N(6)-adenine-specific methyltransferase METTL4 [Dryobates pubescens]